MSEGVRQAQAARTRLGLALDGPAPDVLRVVEDTGGLAVSIIELPDGVSGAYARREGQGFAFLNMLDHPVRQRFTLAHELGHHEFNDGGVIDAARDVFGKPKAVREQRANAFAAEFLVPLVAMQRWAQAQSTFEFSLLTIVKMASYFRVSAQVGLYRMSAAGLAPSKAACREIDEAIDQGQHLTLARRHQLHDLPDEISSIHATGQPRLPRQMWEYAVTGYELGLLTAERIARALQRDVGDVQVELDELGVWPPDDEPDY